MTPDAPIRVLLVEDDPDDYVLIRDLIAEIDHCSIELEWTSKVDDALGAVDSGHYDILLTDYRLGKQSGLELLEEVMERSIPIPVIVLTGQGEREIDLAVMRHGAADYLVKGEITAPLLERSIRYALERHRLMTDLRDQTLQDELTGVHNRRGFSLLSEQQYRLARRKRTHMAVFFVDLDRMKQINDVYGHAAGDAALSAVAGLLRQTFRSSDVVARLGGDEFGVLAVECSGSQAEVLLERLARAVDMLNGNCVHSFSISISVGYAVYDSADPDLTLEALLQRADEAMYDRKQSRKPPAASPQIRFSPGFPN